MADISTGTDFQNPSYSQILYDYAVERCKYFNKPLTPVQDAKLQQLLWQTPGFNSSYNPDVRNHIVDQFIEFAVTARDMPITDANPDGRDNARIDRFIKVVGSKGMRVFDDPVGEKEIFNAYRDDKAFSSNVDKLVKNDSMNAVNQKITLNYLRGTRNRKLYDKEDILYEEHLTNEQRQTIQNNVYAATTYGLFFNMPEDQGKAVVDKLFEDDGKFALQPDGAQKAFEATLPLLDRLSPIKNGRSYGFDKLVKSTKRRHSGERQNPEPLGHNNTYKNNMLLFQGAFLRECS